MQDGALVSFHQSVEYWCRQFLFTFLKQQQALTSIKKQSANIYMHILYVRVCKLLDRLIF